jgi:hypothetical protein
MSDAWVYRHGWLVWGKGIKALSIPVSSSPPHQELIRISRCG